MGLVCNSGIRSGLADRVLNFNQLLHMPLWTCIIRQTSVANTAAIRNPLEIEVLFHTAMCTVAPYTPVIT